MMLTLTRHALRALIVANLLFGLMWTALFASTLYDTGFDLSFDRGPYLLQTLLNVVTAVLVHLILRALFKMLDDATRGLIWTRQTVGHLYTVGWALVGVAILSLRASLAAATGTELVVWNVLWRLTGDSEFATSIRPSLTIWLAVPLVFTLAAIFREGIRMREDLEGTV